MPTTAGSRRHEGRVGTTRATANPTAAWTYHQVKGHFTFRRQPRYTERVSGASQRRRSARMDGPQRGLSSRSGRRTWNLTQCTGKNTPAGGGGCQQRVACCSMGFSELGLNDTVGVKAPRTCRVDMDMDGCKDVVVDADWLREGLSGLSSRGPPVAPATPLHPSFSFGAGQPHGTSPPTGDDMGRGASRVPMATPGRRYGSDGRPDVISAEERLACSTARAIRTRTARPYLYVFIETSPLPDSRTARAHHACQPFRSKRPDGDARGRQPPGWAAGRQDRERPRETDGIMDICVASKLGLAVFLGQGLAPPGRRRGGIMGLAPRRRRRQPGGEWCAPGGTAAARGRRRRVERRYGARTYRRRDVRHHPRRAENRPATWHARVERVEELRGSGTFPTAARWPSTRKMGQLKFTKSSFKIQFLDRESSSIGE